MKHEYVNFQNQDGYFQTLKLTSLFALMNSFNVAMENVLIRNCFAMNNRIALMDQMKLLVELIPILTGHPTVISVNVNCLIVSALPMVQEFPETLILHKYHR